MFMIINSVPSFLCYENMEISGCAHRYLSVWLR